MNEFQKMVHDFNIAIESEQNVKLRAELIREEVEETLNAIKVKDPIATIDGLCDVLYVVYGAADVFGFTLSTLESQIEVAIPAQGWDKIQTNLFTLGQRSSKAINALLKNAWPEVPTSLESLADNCWVIGNQGLGVDLCPFFKEIHRTNMLKLIGPVRLREDGKRLKPEGWEPPKIAEMYLALQNNSI